MDNPSEEVTDAEIHRSWLETDEIGYEKLAQFVYPGMKLDKVGQLADFRSRPLNRDLMEYCLLDAFYLPKSFAKLMVLLDDE